MIVALRATQIIHTPSTPAVSTRTLATAPAAAATAPTPLSPTGAGGTPPALSSLLSSFIIPDLVFKSRSGAGRIFALSSGSSTLSSSLRMVSSSTPTNPRRRFAAGGLEPYYKNLGAFLSQVLTSLDAAFGTHLYTQSKPLPGIPLSPLLFPRGLF